MSLIRYQPTELAAWMPFDRLSTFRNEINRLFDFPQPDTDAALFGGWSPALDVYDQKESFLVFCELPGLQKENIEITVHNNTVTISGERKTEREDKKGESFRNERYFGKFQRSVTLPANVESSQVKATYMDGVLQVELPKSETAKQKKIQVNAA